jgi:hypothetical protein
VIANDRSENEAAIVWVLAETGGKVYDATAPTDTPSTSTSAMVWHASGVIVKEGVEPGITGTVPAGSIAPPAPALAVTS